MRKKLLWKIIGGAGVLLFLATMMLWLAGAFRHKTRPGPPAASHVVSPAHTALVESRVFPQLVEQSGTIHNRIETRVASRIMAQVVEILTYEGVAVTGATATGQATLMARLDDRDIAARLQQSQSQVIALDRAIESAVAQVGAARAQLQAAAARRDQASTDYQRYVNLYADKVVTAQQLDLAKAQNEVATAQENAARKTQESAESEAKRLKAQKQQADEAVAEARVTLDYTLIRSPISGRVSRRMVEIGDTVAPGQTIFTVESNGQPELHAVVSESLLEHLPVGEAVKANVDALALSCRGTVREIIPWSDPTTRTVLVKITLPQRSDLVSGMFGRLFIPIGDYKTLVVPQSAVKKVGQLDLVEVFSNGAVHRRFVTTGKTHNNLIEMLSGVGEGEMVVLP
jgi:HlyD family secretion protein